MKEYSRVRKNGSPIPTVSPIFAPKPVIELTSHKFKYFWQLDPDYLEQEYIKNGKSMAQIAREKGCARSIVGSAIARFRLVRDSLPSRHHQRGQLAYGEKFENGRVVSHKEEQKILQIIVEMRKDGFSCGMIANRLNIEGYPTKNRVMKWDRPTVYKLVKRVSTLPSGPTSSQK